MRLNEVIFDGPVPIDSYGPGFFRVSGAVINGPLMILPDRHALWSGLSDPAPFLAAAADFDVLLLGTGAEIAPLPAELRQKFEAAGIGVEIMATPAACRTYNVLLAEGRRIAAALLPV